MDIATICGTTGLTILIGCEDCGRRKRSLSQVEEEEVRRPIDDSEDRRLQEDLGAIGDFKLGLIVQSISINANMPLPVAP